MTTKPPRRRFRLVWSAKHELEHLEALERDGESPATAYIALGGVALVLVPIFLLMLGIALAAYYLA